MFYILLFESCGQEAIGGKERAMLPNNNEIMYRRARQRAKEIQDEVAASRSDPLEARRRLALWVGIGLIGLTLMAVLALGWWVL
jgi:hypothetical protein